MSKYLLLSVLAVTSCNVWASGPPVMFSDCAKKVNVIEPRNANGYYFSEDCGIVYVLPPKDGDILVSEPTRTENTRLCSTLDLTLSVAESRSKQLKRLLTQIENEEVNLGNSNPNDPWLQGSKASSSGNNEEAFEGPNRDKVAALHEEAEALASKILEANERYAEFEGPYVKLTISADHNQLLQQYRKLNSNLDVRAMPIAKSQLTFIQKTEKNIGKAPAALHWSVAGVKSSPEYFTGIKPSTDLTESPDGQSVLFSGAVSGQVVLSLLGACPFYDLQSGKMPSHISANQLSAYLVSTVDYAYNVQVNRAYKAEYNLYQLFKRIQEQSTKRRLFSSKTLHSLIVEQKSEGWFKFTSLSQDPRHEWDEQLAQTIKAQLIGRLLTRLGAIPIGTGSIPGLIAPGESGASVISKDLGNCPDVYCQAGAYVLRGLDAMLGSSNAMASFRRETDHNEVEVVHERKMVPQLSQVRLAK